MTIFLLFVLLLGSLFAPNATPMDALLCTTDEAGGWNLELCAIEFADHIPFFGETIQSHLRDHYHQQQREQNMPRTNL